MRFFAIFCGLIFGLLLFGSVVGMQESFAEESSWVTSDFTIQGGTLIEIEDYSIAGSIILYVEMDTDGYVIVTKTHHMSANPDCTPTDDLFVLIDGVAVEGIINKNDHSLSINIPKDSKEIEIISSHVLVLHTTSSMYAEFCKVLDDGKTMSPHIQTKKGFLVPDVICKNNLVLIFSELSNKPACVKSDSVNKFLDRGYSTKHLFKLPFSNMYKLNDTDDSIIRYHLYDTTLTSMSKIEHGIRIHVIPPTYSSMISISIPHNIMNDKNLELNYKNCNSGSYSFSVTPTHLMYVDYILRSANHLDFICN